MNRYIGASIVCAALGACLDATGQVANMAQPAMKRVFQASKATGQAELTVSIIPATVTLAGGRREEGWFTVVSEPLQKLFWWRFQAGTVEAGSSFPVDEFINRCASYVESKQLLVFCTTARRLLIASSTQTYDADAALPGLVRADFNRRAARLDTGFDYFDRNLDLWKPLGVDFFSEPGRANSIPHIGVRSVARVGQNWEVVVTGAGKAAAKLRLSPDFTLLATEPLQ